MAVLQRLLFCLFVWATAISSAQGFLGETPSVWTVEDHLANDNDRDELVLGKRYWSDQTPVTGQQYEYDYDNIGNRGAAKWGGDANG